MNKTIARFADGPLEGQEHYPAQCPVMLRVVVHMETKEARCLMGWETVDADSEVVFYIAGARSSGFWDGRDPKTGRHIGGTMTSATYHVLRPDLRPECGLGIEQSPSTWRSWCDDHLHVLLEEHKRLRAEDDEKARERRRIAAEQRRAAAEGAS